MVTSIEWLSGLVDDVRHQVIEWRRHLHKNPELSFQEEKTSQFIYDTLLTFSGLEVSRPTRTSVMARLIGAMPGKTLAIRADIDALPITEETSFDFTSGTPGVMHACGHDGHTAMLLGAAKVLSRLKDEISGEIRFLFQHAEEVPPGGAREMVDAGVMDGVNTVIGIHLQSGLPTGQIGVVAGPMTAAPDTFHLTIQGKGGHGAYPHETVDPVTIAAQVITNLQHIVSRNVDPLDPLVVSVTKIFGGTAYNIIPEVVEFGGTVRSYNPALRETIPGTMERIAKGITEAHGASYTFRYEKGYHPVINDEETTQVVRDTLGEVFGAEAIVDIAPAMAGDDYSAFQMQAPGTFFIVGARNESKGMVYPHHHPRFAIDEDALEIGVKAYVHIAFKLLV